MSGNYRWKETAQELGIVRQNKKTHACIKNARVRFRAFLLHIFKRHLGYNRPEEILRLIGKMVRQREDSWESHPHSVYPVPVVPVHQDEFRKNAPRLQSVR